MKCSEHFSCCKFIIGRDFFWRETHKRLCSFWKLLKNLHVKKHCLWLSREKSNIIYSIPKTNGILIQEYWILFMFDRNHCLKFSEQKSIIDSIHSKQLMVIRLKYIEYFSCCNPCFQIFWCQVNNKIHSLEQTNFAHDEMHQELFIL